jgi:hypothetical protein
MRSSNFARSELKKHGAGSPESIQPAQCFRQFAPDLIKATAPYLTFGLLVEQGGQSPAVFDFQTRFFQHPPISRHVFQHPLAFIKFCIRPLARVLGAGDTV